MAKLTFILDDGQEIEVALAETVTIGSAEGNDVVVDDPRISNKHAQLRRESDGRFQVADLRSNGGTFVNGNPVEKCFLGDGDTLRFGPLNARFLLDADPGVVEVISKPETSRGNYGNNGTGLRSGSNVGGGVASARTPVKNKKKEQGRKREQGVAASPVNEAGASVPENKLLAQVLSASASDLNHREASGAEVSSNPIKEPEPNDASVNGESAGEVLKKTGPILPSVTEEVVVAKKETAEVNTAVLPPAVVVEDDQTAELLALRNSRQLEIEVLTKRLESIRSEFAASEVMSTELSKEVHSLQSRKETLTEELSSGESRLETLKADIADAEVGSRENRDRLSQLRIELADTESVTRAAVKEKEALQAACKSENIRLDDLKQKAAGIQSQISQLNDEMRSAMEELSVKKTRVAELTAKETHLNGLTVGLAEIEKNHATRTGDLEHLETLYSERHGHWDKLVEDISQAEDKLVTLGHQQSAAKLELDALAENKDKTSVKLEECRKTLSETETQLSETSNKLDTTCKELSESEKKLEGLKHEQIEVQQRVDGLKGTEERLLQAKADLASTEKAHAELTSAQQSLEAKHITSQERQSAIEKVLLSLSEQQVEAEKALDVTRTAHHSELKVLEQFQQEAAKIRVDLETQKAKLDEEIKQVQKNIEQAKLELQEITGKRAEIAKQCDELASTEDKLVAVKADLADTQQRHGKLEQEISELTAQKSGLESALQILSQEEITGKERLEFLRSREVDLKHELGALSTREREDRSRFEEIRRLITEADREHAAQKDRLNRDIELSQRELSSLEARLSPLRKWKGEMDNRYERLAQMPESSDEARQLWREIEASKQQLGQMVGDSSTDAGSTLDADDAYADERLNVGITGTGALKSGAGQEMALKVKISRLRESIQREASRLEFLRQERAREETRNKSGTQGEAQLREHDRHLETKIRRDEERYSSLQRNIEIAELEEAKRRERVAELEHKIAELKADIAEAERDRGDARQQVDMVQAELKAQEVEVERSKRSAFGNGGQGILASIVEATRKRSPSTLKPMGSPRED